MIDKAISQIKTLADIDCIVGKSVKNDFGDTIIPISKISVGIIAGGGEYNPLKRPKRRLKDDFPFSGALGSGCTISPVGFLVVSKDKVHYINNSSENNLSKILDLAANFIKAQKKD
jgi:sporulation protein YtfJ